MKSQINCPAPGEVWEAWQLFFSHERTRVEPKDDNSGVAHIPVVRHPALLLAHGDSRKLGYLVCYFSTKEDDERNPPHHRCGHVLDENKTSYLIAMAPNYCPRDFLIEPYRVPNRGVMKADPQLRKLVCDKMAWGTGSRGDASAGNVLSELLNNWFTHMQDECGQADKVSDFAAELDLASAEA